MIRALRRRHLALWIVLAILLPVLFICALRARRQPPVQELPAALAPQAAPADDVARGER
jgi:glucan phosphoethanolaminetransferase (alkaline phosphatase superfamily)